MRCIATTAGAVLTRSTPVCRIGEHPAGAPVGDCRHHADARRGWRIGRERRPGDFAEPEKLQSQRRAERPFCTVLKTALHRDKTVTSGYKPP
jgi:hypothetical protein